MINKSIKALISDYIFPSYELLEFKRNNRFKDSGLHSEAQIPSKWANFKTWLMESRLVTQRLQLTPAKLPFAKPVDRGACYWYSSSAPLNRLLPLPCVSCPKTCVARSVFFKIYSLVSVLLLALEGCCYNFPCIVWTSLYSTGQGLWLQWESCRSIYRL